jgi:hypothetical protein
MKTKMVNGQLPTWYVIKRISADLELYAKAPSTDEFFESKCEYFAGDPLLFVRRGGRWREFVADVTTRYDWTLYRRGGKKRKAKSGEVKLGRVFVDDDVTEGNTEIESAIEDLRGTYDIIAVSVKP